MLPRTRRDLLDKRPHGGAATVEETLTADLDDVHLGEDSDRRAILGPGEQIRRVQRAIPQRRRDRLAGGRICRHGQAFLGAVMTVPTGSPASARVSTPALSPLTTWTRRVLRAWIMLSITER